MTALPPNESLFAALRAAFPDDLDATAIETTAPDGTPLYYSWGDIERASARMANLLESLGLPEGSRVAVQVEKSVEALLLYLATLRAGFVFLPLNTAYQSAEIAYFIGNAEPAVVVCTPGNFGWVSKIAFTAGTAHVFAMLTHGNLLSNAVMLNDYWGWRRDDVLIHALPIFHVHGLFVAVHAALLGGSKMIWLAKFDPQAVIAALPRATVFMGVPTLYVRMLGERALTREAARNMRLFISGSAPLLIETFRDWQSRTGHTILERYGMSETIMLTSNPYQADARHGGQHERRGGTVGFALPGVGLRVVGDDDRELPAGETGNIQVSGPNVFKGYWRMPEKTAEEFTPDGWFKTGDVGVVDERGYVRIVGRSKDLIISGGYNVYPAEVEGTINDMPGVMESAVVGVPHPDFGEVGVAVVIPRPGAQLDGDAILSALKSQLANFKIPKRCFVAQELPRNTMGKVQKNLLRAQYQGLFA